MKTFLSSALCVLCFMFYVLPIYALTFDLIAPTEQLTRGQDVKFTLNVNTEGKSLTTAPIGMTYDTQYLEYVSTAPGDSFTTVAADVQAGGKLILTGSSTAAYSGSGAFAYVTFKLIATSAGSTELCTLYNPLTTPTPGPTSTPVPNAPAPTALPKTGQGGSVAQGAILASLLFAAAGVGFFAFKNT